MRRKMEDGRWKMEDGRWKMEDGRWKMEDERWKMEPPRINKNQWGHYFSPSVLQFVFLYFIYFIYSLPTVKPIYSLQDSITLLERTRFPRFSLKPSISPLLNGWIESSGFELMFCVHASHASHPTYFELKNRLVVVDKIPMVCFWICGKRFEDLLEQLPATFLCCCFGLLIMYGGEGRFKYDDESEHLKTMENSLSESAMNCRGFNLPDRMKKKQELQREEQQQQLEG